MIATNTGVLVSSEHGDACCYELTGTDAPIGIIVGSHDASCDPVEFRNISTD